MWEHAKWCAGADKSMGDKRWYWLLVVQHFSAILYQTVVCRLLGHDYETHADAENGTEDVWCNRCGWSEHYRF